ncbi:MAG: hypothetical protein E5W01_11640 [Mesorhizobium sp.]|nr:MAG: hypothetical protein E5W01_11640 [Mesorhizobium sp.]
MIIGYVAYLVAALVLVMFLSAAIRILREYQRGVVFTLGRFTGKHELDEMLAERDKLNSDIQEILDQRTDAWGIKVSDVEIKHVDLNENMVRAIAKQAEAERLRRAKVINADGEQQAAAKLVEAGKMLSETPQAMQLRFFEALHDIAGERSSTVVFPVPMDLLGHFIKQGGEK